MKNLYLISIMLITLNYGYGQNPSVPSLVFLNSGTGVLLDSINDIDSAVIDQNLNHLLYKNGTVHSNLPISAFDSILFYMPAVFSLYMSDITATTLFYGGQVSNCQLPITACGLCWSTSSFPTIPSINQLPGTGSTLVHAQTASGWLFGLQPSTTYHFRIYATIGGVTYYSHEKIITTLPPCAPLPTVTTDPVTSITYQFATVGGKVTSQGCSAIRKEGVSYGNINPPDFFNGQGSFMSGTPGFSHQVNVYNPSSKYYVRAFAFNDGGIAYGNVDSFSTPAAPNPSGKIAFYVQNIAYVLIGINIYDSPSYSNQVASGCIGGSHPNGLQVSCQNPYPLDFVQTLPAGTYYFKAYDLNGAVSDSGPIVIVANGCSTKNVAPGSQVQNGNPNCTNCYCHH